MAMSFQQACEEAARMRGYQFRNDRFYGFEDQSTGTRRMDIPATPEMQRRLYGLAHHIESADREAEAARAASRRQAYESVSEQTGYRFTGFSESGAAGWTFGTSGDRKLDRGRRAGQAISGWEREQLNAQAETILRNQQAAEADAAVESSERSNRLGMAARIARGALGSTFGNATSVARNIAGGAGLMGIGASLGTAASVGGGLVSGASRELASVASTTMAHALSAAGQTGQGVTEIGTALLHTAAQGVSSVASVGVELGTAIIGAVAAGVTSVLSIGALAIGGVLLTVFVGAIGLVAASLGRAIGEMFGAVGQALTQSLEGVVTILKDLTRTGREFAGGGVRMMGLGGMGAGQASNWMMAGMGLGMSPGQTAGMFGSWGMRPEFLGPRMALLGASPGMAPEQQILAMQRSLSGMPGILQYPMLNAATGGHADQFMSAMMLPPGVLAANQAARSAIDPGGDMMTRFALRTAPLLDRIVMVVEGIKLRVLDQLAPLMEVGLNTLLGLWMRHWNQIRSLIERIPEFIGKALQFLTVAAAYALQGFAAVYVWGKDQFLPWVKSDLIPTMEKFWGVLKRVGEFLSGFLGVRVPGTSAGSGGASGGAGAHGGGSMSPWARAGEATANTVGWAGEHPWAAGALGFAGMGAAGAAQSGLRWMALHPRATWNAGRAALGWMRGGGAGFAGSAMAGMGLGHLGAGLGGNTWWGQALAGLGSVGAGAAAGGAMGGGAGAIVGAGSALIGGLIRLGTETSRLRQSARAGDATADRMRAMGLDYARDASGRTPRQAQLERERLQRADPVLSTVSNWQKYLGDMYQKFSPENMRRFVDEAMRQKIDITVRNEGQISVQPSAEFAAQLEMKESLASLRRVQFAAG